MSQGEFEMLTRPHLDALYRFAARSVGNAAAAEDLVQDACLKAYRALGQFERGTNYRAWLFRILANTIVDWRRRASRTPAEVLIEEVSSAELMAGASAPSRPTDPETRRAMSALSAELDAALGSLPEAWQAVLLLSFVEDLSYKEIAGVLACPVGTVMSRLYRARRALRRRLSHLLDSPIPSAQR
jgi:RNA polymerase sigma-70 factor (ECF subfamily)